MESEEERREARWEGESSRECRERRSLRLEVAEASRDVEVDGRGGIEYESASDGGKDKCELVVVLVRRAEPTRAPSLPSRPKLASSPRMSPPSFSSLNLFLLSSTLSSRICLTPSLALL